MRYIKSKIHIIVWLTLGFFITGAFMNIFNFLVSLLIGAVLGYVLMHVIAQIMFNKTGTSFLAWARNADIELTIEKIVREVLISRNVFTEETPARFVKARASRESADTVTVFVPVGKESGQIINLIESFKDALTAYSVKAIDVQPGYVTFAIYFKDALDLGGEIVPVENEENKKSNVYKPVKIGINETGETATVELFSQTVLVGGSPGSGKSGTSWALLSHAALDPRTVLVVIDLKPYGIETAPLHERADFVATTDQQAEEILHRVWLEVQERNKHLAEKMLEKVPKESDEFPPIMIFCDEAAELSRSNSEEGKKALDYLTRIVAVGRASGVGVVIITQKPDSQVLPTALRDLINQRLCLRVGNREQAKTILGDIPEGVEPWAIASNTQGRGYLRDSSGKMELIQGVYLDRDQVIAMGKKAAELHKEHGKPYQLPEIPQEVEEEPDSDQPAKKRRRRR